MSETGYWIHNLDPKLIHIYGNIGVSYYGLAYVLAFVFCIVMHRLYLRKNRSPFILEQEELALYACVLGVLLGARVGYVILYALPDFFARPWFIFEVWNGGMSFHGGFIGVVIACWYIYRRTGVTMLQFSDMITTMAPMGLLLGRIANFINGELWGHVTNVWWAVVFLEAAPALWNCYRHVILHSYTRLLLRARYCLYTCNCVFGRAAPHARPANSPGNS